ncbi:MAG: VCBS repeat-containing protein [Pseudomonadales bacterium]|nr:VCBS repeat-containing protein [Pseudomonadales bacterium]
MAACGGGGGGGSPSPPIEPPPPPIDPTQPALRFTEQAANAGLTRTWGYAHAPMSDPEFMASGLAAVDYDLDGDIDVYVAGGDLAPNRLFENQGDGTFVDVAPDVGLDLVHKGSGPTFADIDGDGDLDVFIGAVEDDPYYLMENRDGTFVDVTPSSGLDIFAPNTFSAAFADYDEDGDLDMALAHWGNPERDDTETLWRNNGEWTFESYSRQARIAETLIDSSDPEELQIRAPAFRRDNSFTPNFTDIDSDGDLDLLMASDFRTSQVFSNDGDGRFTLTTDREVIKDQGGWARRSWTTTTTATSTGS